MKNLLKSVSKFACKPASVIGLCLSAFLTAAPASATLINFDDLYFDPYAENYTQPIENQYAAQGVTFFEAYLGNDAVHNNYAMTLGGFVIEFTGQLPSLVDFTVFTESNDGLEVNAYNTDGSYHKRLVVPPFSTGTKVSLANLSGISRIELYNLQERTVMGMDDLNFSQTTVPEPVPLALLASGLFAVYLRKIRKVIY